MFNFTLKNLYDNKVGSYLLLIALFKWGGIVFTLLGIFLAVWFNNYWIAIIGGILLSIIGIVVALITHFISKKLSAIIVKGGNLVEGTENYLKDQAIQQAKKFIDQRKNNGNKSS
ncbi:hypothetical protein MTZ49_05780 [Entomomonas sp. E2T0]|uniref:hypothetical protein n=1 Tax=Entomomonas sp. E2T0 TaxID=2930213 RepID=UPI002228212B|nr:hypothetical protein [Entomomonas sp. E2T0]UYZ85065.1 hypothetical protein MTZ49_05780 [Entomomonas sp. E2T0]